MRISQKAFDIALTVFLFVAVALLAVSTVMQEDRMGESVQPFTVHQRLSRSTVTTGTVPVVWAEYTSPALGFSFKYPKEVYDMANRVPVKIDEDAKEGTIHIGYELSSGTDEGWTLHFGSAKDDKGLEAVVRKLSGSYEQGKGCHYEKREAWTQQAGVFKVAITGEDWGKPETDLGNTTCIWPYDMLYYPASGAVMAVDRLQEAIYYDGAGNTHAVDEEITNSFRFK